ncbi:hypothetical protein [Actinacidiphila acididurans]|uniref:Uncharacterized protein n=1 Tax=Actinacidiphila acididurans TaxID=2784346 RepID=A0ABS2TLS1_9ACTN|nr:hypothetical protein [Actinacidiphila acididurans]MBM9504283.1 hypothetical protein [Actinacidiphila acididurans]
MARYWGDPTAHPSATALARFAGPAAQRRLARGSLLNSVCLSGVTLLLLGGAWLPRRGGAGTQNPVAFAVALGGLAVFLAGCLGQISLAFLGRPRFVLPKHARHDNADLTGRPSGPESGSSLGQGADTVSASLPVEHKGTAEILVIRDEADSYAQLRRYKVYVDGKRVGNLRRGENCVTSVAPGPHTVQVKISWCTSPVSRVDVAPGDRLRFLCRARPGVESDPTAVYRLRHDFLVLHPV